MNDLISERRSMMLLLWSWDPNYVWFARDTGRRREARDDCKRNKLICLFSSLWVWVWMNMLFTITLTPICLALSHTQNTHTHTYRYTKIHKHKRTSLFLTQAHTHKAYLSDFLFFLLEHYHNKMTPIDKSFCLTYHLFVQNRRWQKDFFFHQLWVKQGT